jgi:hypothetical protein
MLVNKELQNNTEIILAMLLASGMILLLSFPEVGKITGLAASGLIALLYLYEGLSLLWPRRSLTSFQVILDIINFFSCAMALLLMVSGSTIIRNLILPGLMASGILIICLILNLSNRYIYKIRDENYVIKQIRLLLLLLLCFALMISGKYY